MSEPFATPVSTTRSDAHPAPVARAVTSRAVVEVERFTGEAGEWDAFVRGSAGWTNCHLAGWRTVIERACGHDCIYLAARDGAGTLSGVLPLVRVKSMVFGHFLVSMPFLNYGGPLGSEEAVEALVRRAVELATESGAGLLELRRRSPLATVPSGEWSLSTRKITVVLDLSPGDAPAVWKRLDGKLRSQIRRPQKEGVTVRFGAAEVGPFYAVFSRHMRDLGTPTLSRRWFEEVAAAFRDDVWFACAYLGNQPVAGGCGFRSGDEFEITWASALNAYKQVAPNMLLYWSFIERAAEARIRTFNFGRCTPESGTHKFKRQWGSRDEQLSWYDFTLAAPRGSGGAPHAGRGAKTPSPDDAAYAWGPRLWKHLPLGIATAIGPRIVKYIP